MNRKLRWIPLCLSLAAASLASTAQADEQLSLAVCQKEIAELELQRFKAIEVYKNTPKSREQRKATNAAERKRLLDKVLRGAYKELKATDLDDLDKSSDSKDLSDSILKRVAEAFRKSLVKDCTAPEKTAFVTAPSNQSSNGLPGLSLSCQDGAFNPLQIDLDTLPSVSTHKPYSGRELHLTVYDNRFTPAVDFEMCLNCAYRTDGVALTRDDLVDGADEKVTEAIAIATFDDNRSNLESAPYFAHYRKTKAPTCTDDHLKRISSAADSAQSRPQEGYRPAKYREAEFSTPGMGPSAAWSAE